METVSSLSLSHFSEKTRTEFFVQSEQDGLFFGLEFVRYFLKSEETEAPEVTAYLSEGECVFKGQTLFRINLRGKDLKKGELMSVVSYLSGAYTLISCFTEKNFDFSVMACSTPGFSFSDWEEKVILKAGGFIQKCPENICFRLEEVHQALERGDTQIILSYSKISREKIKSISSSLPSSVELSLQGSFLPSDLEDFRDFNLKSVWPLCLQGHFPLLKMKITDTWD